ncbi:hypothetical protein HYV74_00845 [Candidatus Uhrbacteria bacterium]|nr:hypothetical protein [Candidatus Uhrbacteria bacterium]
MEGIAAQFVLALGSVLRDTCTAPIWWYTDGMRRMVAWARRAFLVLGQWVGLRFWASHLFSPMFGQTDWQGRGISFGVRVVVLLGRTLQWSVGALGIAFLFAGYVSWPAVAVGLLLFAFGK